MAIEQLGPYRIERLLGRGGMGAVYAGVHEETGEHAAVKVLAELLADDARFRERFRGEVESLKKLRQKNIVSLRGYGEEDGCSYFVMELVEGQSLEEVMGSGRRFTWQEVADIGIQVSAALKHAHDHGVIHRDLKPANLLLQPDGTVKLTDFGIAKFFGGASLTMAGSMIGTPEFMSPEQTEGSSVTPRSDLYSLGCVLYALLAGKPPFHSASITAVIDRVRREEAKPVRILAPQTPVELDCIISDLLRKNPAERVATAQLLSNQLQAMLHALSSAKTTSASSSTSVQARSSVTEVESRDVQTGLGSASGVSASPAGSDFVGKELDQTRDDSTQVSQPAIPSASDGETIEYSTEADLELAEETPRTTHFTPVSEADWRSAVDTSDGTAPKHKDRLSIVVMAVALTAIVGVAAYLLIPQSADGLYQRILTDSLQEPLPASYERDLDEFLERFPDDPRAAEVDQMSRDLRCQWLQEELSTKFRELTDEEELYLRGMELVDGGQWDEAATCFQEIVDRYKGSLPNASSGRLVERSEHMLKQTHREAAGQQ